MTCRHKLLLLLILLLLAPTALANKRDEEAAALIAHAKQLSDIRAEGAPAFRLKLIFKIVKEDGSRVEGTYSEVWVSKAQWRRETVLGDFRRVQVAAGRKSWLLDNSTTVPKDVENLLSLSDIGRLKADSWKPRQIADRVVNGTEVSCLETGGGAWGASGLCFDKINGTLTSELRPLPFMARSSEICLYSDYQKFGDRIVARSYECNEEKQSTLQARIIDLVADPTPDPALFMPLEGAKQSVNCMVQVKPPKPVRQEAPVPPGRSPGRKLVLLSMLVRTDGTVQDLKILSTPNQEYDQAALAAATKWSFKPATCDGEPVEATIAAEFEFNLSP